MNRALLITYEPALFLLAALGWAAWEFWSMRTRKDEGKAAPKPASPEDAGHAEREHGADQG